MSLYCPLALRLPLDGARCLPGLVMNRVRAVVLMALCAGRLAASASQERAGEELVGFFSSKTKKLLDQGGGVPRGTKPAVLVIFINLDGGKSVQYVLKRARRVAATRKSQLSFAVASLADSKQDMMEDQQGQRGPCSQPPMRPAPLSQPTDVLRAALCAQEGREPLPLRCRRVASVALWCLPAVADVAAFDLPGRLRARV